MQRALKMAIVALGVIVAGTPTCTAQNVSDLPGMDAVMAVHHLTQEELTANWKTFAADAVLASQGWTLVQSVKPGIQVNAQVHIPGVDVGRELLAAGIQPEPNSIAYPNDEGGFVVVGPADMQAKWIRRYIINAEAQLK